MMEENEDASVHNRLLIKFQLGGIPVIRPPILAKQLDCTFEGGFLV